MNTAQKEDSAAQEHAIPAQEEGAPAHLSPRRLGGMMILFYLAAGANVPIISLYLTKTLGFNGAQTGAVLSMSALSAVAAPVFGAFVADRLVSSERLLAYAQFLSGILLFVLTLQEAFIPVFVLYLLYQMLFQPGVAITNAIVFHHSPDATRQFGVIRKWGTVGWILSGWFFSLFWIRIAGGDIADALTFSALVNIGLGFYALSLPAGPKDAPRRSRLFPAEALRLFKTPAIVGVAVAGFFIQLVDKYYYFGMAPFLKDIGFADSLIMPIMTIGQITEVFFLALLGGIITRIGYRRTLLLGALMELGRFFCFTLVGWRYFAVMGVLFHGPAFALFFSTAFIFINSFTSTESRAGVQQIFNVVTIGLGNFAGSITAGFVYDAASGGGFFSGGSAGAGEAVGSAAEGAAAAAGASAGVAYTQFWLVPLIISGIVAAGIVLAGAIRKRVGETQS